MKILIAASFACLLATMGGCAVYTPGVAVVVDPPAAHVPAERGRFCPPGQAKKGNC
ncbi:MAG TPA: hypothetical protein VGD76_05965 [Ramlibacter sp.]